jgi:hypothetical protein
VRQSGCATQSVLAAMVTARAGTGDGTAVGCEERIVGRHGPCPGEKGKWPAPEKLAGQEVVLA